MCKALQFIPQWNRSADNCGVILHLNHLHNSTAQFSSELTTSWIYRRDTIAMTTRRRALIELLDYDNPVLRAYAFWMSMLVIKMLLMTLLTAAQRMRTKVH